MDIIAKLKASGLKGRGGACFPTWQKWAMVKAAPGRPKYVVVNASEGEPGVHKDRLLLAEHAAEVIDGIDRAVKYLRADKALIYLNPDYDRLKSLRAGLKRAIGSRPVEIVRKAEAAGYIGGEETSVLNALEGRRIEPRLRPPFPPTRGLRGRPTLVGNVETFFDVSLIARGRYERKRFFSVNGDCLWNGVYEFDEDTSLAAVLKGTDNYPDFPFFVQAGGEASGEILNAGQLERPAIGSAAITIYSVMKHEPVALLKRWIGFFARQSCGQCTPCREGTYRLNELINAPAPDWVLVRELVDNLGDASFCGLGCAVPGPIVSFVRNALPLYPDSRIALGPGGRRAVCDCFN